jgi:uncharacterized protein YggE
METEILVSGTAVLRVLPDRAVLRVEVEGEAQTRDEAYAQAAPLATAVDQAIERRRDAVERVITASLVVHPRTRWKRGQSVRTGWRAARTTVLEVTGFAVLGDLMAELAAAGGAVDGPHWVLDADNPVYEEARRRAAADARVRADAYAGALGLRVTAVAWVAEPGLRRGGGGGGAEVAFARHAGAPMAAAGGFDETIEVTPDEVPVTASVEVGFTFGEA